jgi:hypothetical protein
MSAWRGRWRGAALMACVATLWPATQALGGGTPGGDGTATTRVTITVVQNATGVNLCAAGATCKQTVEILNLSIVTVQTGGTLQPARIVTSPTAVNFGRIYVGRKLTKSIALLNAGGAAAVITGERLSGQASAFSLDPGSCTGPGGVRALAPQASCAVHVTFRPVRPRYRQATLVVSSPSGAASTWLEGLGLDPHSVPRTARPRAPPSHPPDASSATLRDPASDSSPPLLVERAQKLWLRIDREPVDPGGPPAEAAAPHLPTQTAGILSTGLAAHKGPSPQRDPSAFPWVCLPLLAALLTVTFEVWIASRRRRTCGLVRTSPSWRRADRIVSAGDRHCQAPDTPAWQPAG